MLRDKRNQKLTDLAGLMSRYKELLNRVSLIPEEEEELKKLKSQIQEGGEALSEILFESD